jgi:hypothetical protein
MTGSAKQSIGRKRKCGLLRRFAPRNDEPKILNAEYNRLIDVNASVIIEL